MTRPEPAPLTTPAAPLTTPADRLVERADTEEASNA